MSSSSSTPSLGHAVPSSTIVHVVGLKLVVWGLEEIKGSDLPIAAVIATHGRTDKKERMEYFAQDLIGETSRLADAEGKKKKRDLIVVTLDQRNHGERIHDRNANLAYDKNERHLADMAACIVGGTQDVSFVIDVLGAYLFPRGERTIDEFIATGISLGGNVTWRLLVTEPRIRIAIPIIGLPATTLHKYLRARAEAHGLEWAAPTYPPALKPVLEFDLPQDVYKGKKILSLHGGADTLVPYAQGKDDIDAVVAAAQSPEDVQVFVEEGVGHAVTEAMVRKTAEWIWRWAMKA